MSGLDRYLTTTALLDCQGRVQHALTLLLDGRIRVRGGTVSYVIDPEAGLVEPPGVVLPDHVLHAAAELAGHPIAMAGRGPWHRRPGRNR